jgi:hypothetical protein
MKLLKLLETLKVEKADYEYYTETEKEQIISEWGMIF